MITRGEIFLTRREWLQKWGVLLLLGALPAGTVTPTRAQEVPSASKKNGSPAAASPPEVSPAEDLMREHGVLQRGLLIYEEIIRRLDQKKDFSAGVAIGTAQIIQKFIEKYHEKLEEDFLFPRFEKAGKLVGLVAVLRRQHQIGRKITTEVLSLGKGASSLTREAQKRLAELLRMFIRMYRPHAAREDTILFPAFRSLVSDREYQDLGEEFDKRETDLFGVEGFEKIVAEVAGLERQLDIYDLDQFIPKL